MLQFVLGRSGTGKTTYVRDIAQRAAIDGKKVYFMVPDQFTFDYEKYFILNLSPDAAANIRVYSFTRLSDEILRTFGECAVQRIDDSSRLLIMNEAISSCSDNLRILNTDSSRLAEPMVKIVNELKNDGITAEMLGEASGNVHSTLSHNLRDKLNDIGLIYSAYEAVIAGSYADASDIINTAAEKIKNVSYFADSIVIFDSFETIDSTRRKLVYAALRSAEQVFMTFCCPGVDDESDFFAPVIKTAKTIRRYCIDNRIGMMPSKLFTDYRRSQSDNLALLSENVFSDYHKVSDKDPGEIVIYEAKSIIDELEFTASRIRDLIVTDGMKYSDIAVMCHDASEYSILAESIFRKWEIPCYYSSPENLNSSPLVRFILSAFSVVLSSYRTEDILNMLKTDLTFVSVEDTAALENYSYIWHIDGRKWKAPFTMSPGGLSEKKSVEDEEFIAHIESVRDSVITKLTSFSEKIKNTDGESITREIFGLIEDFGVKEKLSETAEELRNSGLSERADDILRVWNRVMNVFDIFVTVLGSKSVTPERYFELMRTVLSAEDRRDVPLRSDTIIFGSLDAVMQSSPKVSFIIGAQNGELPYIPQSTSLITDSEKQQLSENSLNLENNMQDIAMLEVFNTYKAVSSPSEKLFVSYHLKSNNEDSAEGELVESIMSIFPNIEVMKDYSSVSKLNSSEAVFSHYASIYNSDDIIKPTLEAFLSSVSRFSERLDALKNSGDRSRLHISNRNISRQLLKNGALSASQIEVFHHCRFRYFCQYTLNTKERVEASVDSRIYGTLMHYLFEKILSSGFEKYADEDELLEKDIYILINKFKREEINGAENLQPVDEYRINRLALTAFSLIKRMLEEFAQSKFKPTGWEEHLSDSGTFPPFKIVTRDGQTISVGGIIDRVDTYKSPSGETYIRIVDYKTGVKKFTLSDVVYGLNLQMLIYLAAICSEGKYLPAGILYMPASSVVISMAKGSSEESIKSERNRKQRMNGAVLDSLEIVRAMEDAAAGKFIPVKLNKNGTYESHSVENVYTDTEFHSIFDYIRRLITTMADTIIDGDLSPKPMMKDQNSCVWCPYKAVCLSAKDDSDIEKGYKNKEEAMPVINGGELDA